MPFFEIRKTFLKKSVIFERKYSKIHCLTTSVSVTTHGFGLSGETQEVLDYDHSG